MLSEQRTSLPQPASRRKHRLRLCTQSMAILLCAFVLSGCEGSPGNTPASEAHTTDISAARTENENTAAEGSAIAPLLPPGAGARPSLPGQGAGLSALPSMQPPKGLNVDTLFAEDIQDPMARIKRLENVVLDMRRDFNTVLPSIMRLVAVEQDMQNLIGQLETLTDQSSAAVPAEAVETSALTDEAASEDLSGSTQQTLAPQSGQTEDSQPPPDTPLPDIPAEETEEEAQAPPLTGPPELASAPKDTPSASAPVSGAVRLRVGDHSGKTRLVLETGGTTAFRADLDNAENLLVIELPDADATGTGGKESVADAHTVKSWSVEAMEGGAGVRVIVELQGSVSIQKTLAVPASGESGARIVVDLAPKG